MPSWRPGTSNWRQTWVDSSGSWVEFTGGMDGDAMVLTGPWAGAANGRDGIVRMRYTREANRLYGVLDKRLADREFIAGEFSIADVACWPWLRQPERHGQNRAEFPNLSRWFDAVAARPAVKRGAEVGKELGQTPVLDDEARKHLFGETKK